MKISFEEAVQRLSSGSVVAVPTETVYGLAATLTFSKAIENIFALKKRPADNPLIIHIAETKDIFSFVKEVPAGFFELTSAFWPGPLTLVLDVDEAKIPEVARAGLSTGGFRMPLDLTARALISRVGPLVMPSANLSGRPSATTKEHVEQDFGKDFPVLEGRASFFGLESTVLCFKEGVWVLARQGALPKERFLPVLGYTPKVLLKNLEEKPLCPGQKHKHYAPHARLTQVLSLEGSMQGVILGFKERTYPEGLTLFSLGSLSHPESVAENLYSVLRKLDEHEIDHAFVDMDFEKTGILATVAERLSRAAEF